MKKIPLAMSLACIAAAAQERTITLREAVALALKQNPELAIARLNEDKAAQAVRIARDPFVPRVTAGSGLAYSSGFPLSIEGSAPSIFQAQGVGFVFNRRQTHLIGQARENAKGFWLESDAKREDVVHRAAVLYLEAERAARLAQSAHKQEESLRKVAEVVRLRVEEGRELPVEAKRAELNLARARQRAQAFEADRRNAEASLAAVLGLDPSAGLRVAEEERPPLPGPPSEEAAATAALDASTELRRLESALRAKGFEIKAERASRLPQVDLVAQYSLLGRFNNYEDFFRKFQRHNWQLGGAFQIPLFRGPGADARIAQAESDAARLRLELQNARNRAIADSRRLYQQVRQAEAAREVARLDLEFAREQLSVLLSKMEEGRTSLRQIEEARFAEDEKWISFLDSHYAVELARLDLLKHTGGLQAALQ
jgi:outer membrane protein TolC